jgi:hypothetical protein
MDDKFRLVLTRLIKEAYYAALYGASSPRSKEIWERAQHPQPGDFVAELTHMQDRGEFSRGTGRLILVREEPLQHKAWDEAVNGPKPMIKYTYIENLDGKLTCWENCSFAAAPIKPVDDPVIWVAEAMKRHGLEPKDS